jgi:ABC-type uncharacterized transport system substrate-binding protein
MKRREFLALASAVVAWPLSARTQERLLPVIGYLDTTSASATAHLVDAFRRGLSTAGYNEGRNVAIEYRWAEGDYDKLPDLAAELVRRQVRVIATINTPTILAAKAATQTIPIVFAVGVDPIKFGLVQSLSRPSGNITGVTQLNIEMEEKRVQLLHELVPAAKLIAVLINPTSPAYSEAAMESASKAARAFGISLLPINASTPSSIASAFATLKQEKADALLVTADSFLVAQSAQIAALAAQNTVPTLYHRQEFMAAGGLMSYGPSLPDAYYLVGTYTGRILSGESPANLPVHQSAKFDLVINTRVAKDLGLTIPQAILLRADEVIE